jgi:hypothetical protein
MVKACDCGYRPRDGRGRVVALWLIETSPIIFNSSKSRLLLRFPHSGLSTADSARSPPQVSVWFRVKTRPENFKDFPSSGKLMNKLMKLIRSHNLFKTPKFSPRLHLVLIALIDTNCDSIRRFDEKSRPLRETIAKQRRALTRSRFISCS